MKAKKLEFIPTTLLHDGYEVFEMHYNGKKLPICNYFFNKTEKKYHHLIGLEDIGKKTIESYHFSDLPDSTTIDLGFSGSNHDGFLYYMELRRSERTLITYYDIHAFMVSNRQLWNPITYLQEIASILVTKDFKMVKEGEIDSPIFNSCTSILSYEFDNPQGTIDETVNMGINLIIQAKQNAHILLLKLAANELLAYQKEEYFKGEK